jgi:hypothetical protein
MNTQRPRRVAWAVLAAWCALASARGADGRCLRADVPSPIAFPDGTVRPAGILTLCVTNYSPVAAFHNVSLDGLPLGMLFSKRSIAEGSDVKEPIVLFRRQNTGELRLVGYVWPDGTEILTYLLQGEPWDAKTQSRIPAHEAAPPLAEPEPIRPQP